ncbi:MAG TPA: SRPBCC family protein [Acidimicrobiales bacterium]|nr:SRPBCC family protein [Acidimicrobiales bacterium]
MELTNDFEVPVPLDQAWSVLTDVERIAPCMPGAQLKEVEGDEYRGIVKVKVGPITASYRGAARIEQLDADHHRAVLKAEGRETRGQGNASATITASLAEAGDGRTAVSVVTDLNITGKVAQFGRGVLADVSAKLLEQFVANLESTVLAPAPPAGEGAPPAATGPEPAEEPAGEAPAAGAAPAEIEPEAEPAAAPHGGVRRVEHPEPEPVDLVDVARSSLGKRLLPYASIAGAIFLLRIVIYALRRRKK